MIFSKCKRVVSAIILMMLIINMFSTNVYAGGSQSSVHIDEEYIDYEMHDLTKGDFSFDESTGELTILGKEEFIGSLLPGMAAPYADHNFNFPWDEFRRMIKSVKIEDGITCICDDAFRYCDNLTSIIIPDSVNVIGYQAFRGCTSLSSITIPNSVKKICPYAFSGCTGLTSITLSGSTIEIGDRAFENCKGLTSTTTNGVTKIGDFAFCYCTKLASVTISKSVTKIGKGAFSHCYNLTSFTIDEENENYELIDGVLFSKDRTLLHTYLVNNTANNYIVPNSVKKIEEFAFDGCKRLTSITIPESVTEIGGNAFRDCKGLTSLTIPESLKEMDLCASFKGCTRLTKATFPRRKGLAKITFPMKEVDISRFVYTKSNLPNGL